MRNFHGLTFITVVSGTELEDPRTGKKHVVSDGNAVVLEPKCWVTESDYKKLRERLS